MDTNVKTTKPKVYVSFTLDDSMFSGNCSIKREIITQMGAIEEGAISCCNELSHEEARKVVKARFGINSTIPEIPPKVSLKVGDSVIVMGVRGLPRLTDRHEYTADEIKKATFVISKYTVL